MAVYKRDIADINLETGNIHRTFLNHSIGLKDQKADHFGVRVFRDGEPVNLSGVSVQGVFMPPQGSPIAITSGNIVSGNEAEVVLPQACYNYDGQFCLAIKLVDATNSVTGTVRIVDGMVDNTHASGTVAPTSAVPTYQEVLAVYEQAIAAISTVNAMAGKMAVDITAGAESTSNNSFRDLGNRWMTFRRGYYSTPSAGSTSSYTDDVNYVYALVACAPGDVLHAHGYGDGTSKSAWAFLDSSLKILDKGGSGNYEGATDPAPTSTAFALVNVKLASLGSGYYGWIGAEAIKDQIATLKDAVSEDGNIIYSRDLKSAIEADLYYHETDTDAFYWQPKARVNSAGTTYATGNDYVKYTGLKKTTSETLQVYAGSKFHANTGYTLDYSLVQNGTRKQFQRGVAAGTEITIEYNGYLRISVTDGTTDASTEANAKALAKAGLTIDLITEPIKKTVFQNKADIEALKTETASLRSSFEYGEAFTGYVNDSIIVLNVGIGSTVDVDHPTSGSTMCHGIIPCVAGDRFVVTGKGFNSSRAWGFTDTSYKLLSVADSNITVTDLQLTATSDGYLIVNSAKASPHSVYKKVFNTHIAQDIEELKNVETEQKDIDNLTALVSAQKAISEDWHFSFINVFENMGLGANHLIPGTKTIWSQSGTADLDQKGVWMSDGTHPFKGAGVTDMYARTIAAQLAMVVPSYRDDVGETSPSVWAGRRILWMGTSIPAGSDPDAGEGTGATYPALVSTLLGSTSINKAKGSSCVRINASTGTYNGMIFNHFVRALSRTVAECDVIASEWDDIKEMISGAPDTLSESNITTMKNHSFENLLLPYLDGTYTMPDLFVIDHGHNDVRPKGINGKNDLWLTPTAQMITDGILAEDTYMTNNSYANLKLAFNDDLSGISNKANFAATVNRNCFKGAVNFIITLILRYNPYARIAIVSDYN